MKGAKDIRTRYCYTDYVCHAIRFYLSTPETLQMDGKRKADIDNWLAVQDVWRRLPDNDRLVLEAVHRMHFRTAEGVRLYCEKTGADPHDIWALITRINAQVAKRRGLV